MRAVLAMATLRLSYLPFQAMAETTRFLFRYGGVKYQDEAGGCDKDGKNHRKTMVEIHGKMVVFHGFNGIYPLVVTHIAVEHHHF